MRTLIALLALVVFPGTLLQAQSNADLERLTGIRRGLVALPRASQPLALDQARRGYVVYAVCPDQQLYESLTDKAREEGLLNQQIYLQPGPAETPGLAERLADIVLVTDLKADELTDQRRDNWLRILASRRGVLVASGAGISAEQLRTWLGAGVRIAQADGRPVGLLARPAQDGADQWRHRHHGPDNRRVSQDKLIHPGQMLTQWYSLPLSEGFWGTSVVAAGGRAYTLVATRNHNEQVDLVARSLHNGCELWRRHFGWSEKRDGMAAGIYGGRSLMVAGDNELYFGDGANVSVLDGETGKTLATIEGPLADGQVKWMALVGEERLVVLSGEKDNYRKLTFQAFVKNPEGTHLGLYTTTGKPIWQKTCPGPVDEREIAVADGKIYYHARGAGTEALGLVDGETVWSNTKDVESIDDLKGGDINRLLVSDRSLMADETAVIIGASWKANVVALDPDDGRLLWKRPVGKTSRSLAAVLRDGKWYGNAILDARTGKTVSQRGRIPQSICSVTSSVGDWFMTAFGDMYTIDQLEQIRFADVRAPCDIGNIVADGVLLGSSAQCTCHVDIHGYRVTGVSRIDPHRAPPAAGRLETFTTESPEPMDITAADWPTHRHDNRRSGASPVSAPQQADQIWRLAGPKLKPASPGFANRLLPSPAVTADGLTVRVDSMGICQGIDVASGKLLWERALGARSIAAPALSAGRVFVGDMNGVVHALEARTGRILWRFTAAPLSRRIFWYGQLLSTWPCTGGVIVQDGVVYAVAGYQETNGLHAYALDAATGEVRWENHDAGTGGKWGPKGALGLYGNLAIGAGRLWLASGTFYPGSYSLADGSWVAAPSEMDHHFYGHVMRRGADIAVLAEKYVLAGGMRLSSRQEPAERVIKGDGFNALSATNAPEPPKRWKDKSFYGVDMLNWTAVTLSWDEQLLIGGKTKDGALCAWPIESLVEQLDAEFARGVDEDDRHRYQVRSLNSTGRRQPSSPGEPRWGPVELNVQEQILCKDAVLAVHCTYKPHARPKVTTGWYLSCLSRADGIERWRIELPGKPMRTGLALDRLGRVLITFDDGSIACYAPQQ